MKISYTVNVSKLLKEISAFHIGVGLDIVGELLNFKLVSMLIYEILYMLF